MVALYVTNTSPLRLSLSTWRGRSDIDSKGCEKVEEVVGTHSLHSRRSWWLLCTWQYRNVVCTCFHCQANTVGDPSSINQQGVAQDRDLRGFHGNSTITL